MAFDRKIRLLFIDDDGSIRVFAGAMFNNLIFDIKVAANTKEADDLLKKNSFDVIVCDVMMPDEDGIKFCNRLKKSGNSTPFLFLSAVSQQDTVDMGIAAGANAYFIKPFDARELQQKIINLVVPANGTTPHSPTKEPKKPRSWFSR